MTSDGSDASVQTEEEQPKKHLPLWQETILLLAVALGLAILIKALLVQAFYIPSESMEPGLVRNDRILVQKVSYWFGGTPQRGDVVVFKDPGGWLSGSEAVGPPNTVTKLMAKIGLYPSGGHLVKRVIGVAGRRGPLLRRRGPDRGQRRRRSTRRGTPARTAPRATARWSPTATGRPSGFPRARSS